MTAVFFDSEACTYPAVVRPQQPSTVCTAERHGTDDAYMNAHCRCPEAREKHRIARKRRKLRLIESGPTCIAGVGVARRLQALAALGYGIDHIGAHIGMDRSYVHRLRSGLPLVERATFDRIKILYDELADSQPMGSTPAQRAAITKTRRHADRNGWLPPLWWDDDTIDDPTYDPTCTRSGEAVDTVAVERFIAGDAGVRLTRHERRHAFHTLREQGHSRTAAGAQVRISGSTARAWDQARTPNYVVKAAETASNDYKQEAS